MSYKCLKIEELFNLLSSSKKLKCAEAKSSGDFKVISSKKTNDGIIGFTDSPEFFPNNVLITFGDQSKSIFKHNSPFSVTDNVKILELKEEYDLPYVLDFIIYNWESKMPNWGYSRYWKVAKNIEIKFPLNSEEKIDLEKIKVFVEKYNKFDKLKNNILGILNEIKDIEVDLCYDEPTGFKSINLGDSSYFSLDIGNRNYIKDLRESDGQIPVYSANVFKPMGFSEKSNLNSFENDYILWGIDGNFELNLKHKSEIFATTDHCGTIEILDDKISSNYLIYQLNLIKSKYGFDRSLRPSKTRMKEIYINFPINSNGELDKDKQEEIANKYINIKKILNQLNLSLLDVIDSNIEF